MNDIPAYIPISFKDLPPSRGQIKLISVEQSLNTKSAYGVN